MKISKHFWESDTSHFLRFQKVFKKWLKQNGCRIYSADDFHSFLFILTHTSLPSIGQNFVIKEYPYFVHFVLKFQEFVPAGNLEIIKKQAEELLKRNILLVIVTYAYHTYSLEDFPALVICYKDVFERQTCWQFTWEKTIFDLQLKKLYKRLIHEQVY
jgi:hypothetical protein